MTSVKPLHIVVIEDDADTRSNLCDILELDDHRVEMAGSAAEALARPDWSSVSAIILDRGLPDSTADELLPRLRSIAPNAAVIIVTGYSDLGGAVSALRQGATDYILKPIAAEELKARLRHIASYREAQEALRIAERRSRILIQNSSDVITALDRDGTILYQSPSIERMLGYSSDVRVGQNVFRDAIVHPDDLLLKRAFLDETTRRRGVQITAEFRLRHADGTWRHIEAVGQDLLDVPGVEAIVASYRDITERKRSEEALRASEERFRRLFEAGIVGIGTSDRDGNWLEANDELLRILDYSRGELEAGEVRRTEMTPSKYWPLDEQGIAEAINYGACSPYEKEYIRKDGALVPVLIGYARLGRGGDKYICIVLDLSEIKRADREVRRERDFIEGLIEAAPAMVLVLDPAGRIRRSNRFAEDLCGYPAGSLSNRDFFETLLPAREKASLREAFVHSNGDTLATGTSNTIITRGGQEREVRWSHRILKDAESKVTGILAIGQDITDLREAQERALRAERLAAIGQMVAGLAHESRNALQRSQACLEMLALHVQDRPKALDLITRLQRAQDDLHYLYEGVREYAAPIRLERCICNLAEVWHEAWATLEPLHAGRSARLREDCDGTHLGCAADPFRLGQVFRNIFENSLAACRDPVEVDIGCSDTKLNGQSAVKIAICDNGPGLGAQDLDRIFEPFYTTKTKGTGLGMAIVRRIIDAHGGTIEVGTRVDRGAEFIITLPRGKP
ncbi:PAS domain S-box protein [Singulisphaera sp. PoT]|uniref:PAS domain S-box protein n=1 Tax=Singulisphaera sp. PoT TaxID=3411797 RepID=UPI003BF52047